jgi:hypothetical protein
LFLKGFAHRGFITSGDYKVGHPAGGLPFITGDAVIRAFEEEQKLKVSGMAIDVESLATVKSFRGKIGHVYWTKQPVFNNYFISQDIHLSSWQKFCDSNAIEHPYVASAKLLIDRDDLWDRGGDMPR